MAPIKLRRKSHIGPMLRGNNFVRTTLEVERGIVSHAAEKSGNFIVFSTFLAPSGAQGVAISVCHSHEFSRALNLCLYGFNIQAIPLALSQAHQTDEEEL